MDIFIRHCYNKSFDEIIQKYNSNTMTGYPLIDNIIYYKIKTNKDIIYKEDIPKILCVSQEEFMEEVMKDVKSYKLNINNLTYGEYNKNNYLRYYFMSTFLYNEPVDIKIALKD